MSSGEPKGQVFAVSIKLTGFRIFQSEVRDHKQVRAGDVVHLDEGHIFVANIHGISAETFKRLAEELGITHAALKNFFEILEQSQLADLRHDQELAGGGTCGQGFDLFLTFSKLPAFQRINLRSRDPVRLAPGGCLVPGRCLAHANEVAFLQRGHTCERAPDCLISDVLEDLRGRILDPASVVVVVGVARPGDQIEGSACQHFQSDHAVIVSIDVVCPPDGGGRGMAERFYEYHH